MPVSGLMGRFHHFVAGSMASASVPSSGMAPALAAARGPNCGAAFPSIRAARCRYDPAPFETHIETPSLQPRRTSPPAPPTTMAGGDYEELDATPVRRRVVTFLGLSGLVVTAVAAVTVPSSPFALGKSLSALEAVAVTKEFKQTLDPATFAKLKSVTYGTLDTRDQKSLFDQFIDEYSKSYDTTHEYNDRFTIFSKNLNYIDALNAQNPHALFGLNVFADQTEEERSKRRMTDPSITNYTRVKQELKKMMNPTVFEAAEAGAFADGSYKAKMRRLQDAPDSSSESWLDGLAMHTGETTDYELSQGEVGWASGSDCAACNLYPAFGEYDMGNLPDDFDWRELGAVTRVKNQAYCGSCWSFSTAADLEGTHYLATGDLESYAPQQLVECNTMNLGCDGGYPFAAMQYLSHFGGMVTWETMPYKKIVYGDAAWNPTGTPSCDKELLNEKLEDGDVAHISGWQMVAMGADYESLMRVTLVKNGPLSIAFNANGMDYYVHGVVGCTSEDDCEAGSVSHPDQDGDGDMFTCDPTSLDHAVLVVGYGVQHTDGNGKVPYWVIKNSWDDVWGEDGYYRLVRGSNACGVANMVVHSIVKSTTDDDSR